MLLSHNKIQICTSNRKKWQNNMKIQIQSSHLSNTVTAETESIQWKNSPVSNVKYRETFLCTFSAMFVMNLIIHLNLSEINRIHHKTFYKNLA